MKKLSNLMLVIGLALVMYEIYLMTVLGLPVSNMLLNATDLLVSTYIGVALCLASVVTKIYNKSVA